MAQGFTQVEGVDFDETFALVAKLSTLCTILAITAEHNLKVHQMDVKCTYLNSKLEEEIFIEPPPGFNILGDMVFRLCKAVYRTKQGSQVWYRNIKKELESMGYICTKADHALFICFKDGMVSIILIYVNDFSMVCRDIKVIEGDKEALMKAYNMMDLGEITYILGIHVKHDHNMGRIELSQQNFIKGILKHFGKTDVCPISTPALANEHLIKLSMPEINKKQYQSALGTLIYPMLGTCPDLAYTVGALGRHAAAPRENHQCTLEWVFKYLQATKDWSLVYQYGNTGGQILTGFVDADWANERSDHSLTLGYMYKLTGGAISWTLKKQSLITLSSTEAEYIASAHAVKEAIWLRCLLTEIGFPDYDPTTILMDNQSAMTIAKNSQFHNRTKHIDVCYHFLHNKVKSEEIELEYIPIGAQVANMLTKGLCSKKHMRFVMEMGVGRLA